MRRVIFDFDDTIAFTRDRDWDNAEPNTQLITKINEMYNSGKWQIDIYTARGSISCKTREEASLKYRDSIESWLKKHDVLYHTLSFEKPLATYYVDDKALRPDEFIETTFNELEGGLSGSDIYTDGTLVYKQDPRAHIVRSWYEYSRDWLNVPNVNSVIGDTIVMDYIHHNTHTLYIREPIALGLIQESLVHMKQLMPMNTATYDTYINRIHDHYKLSRNIEFESIYTDLLKYNLTPSFAHGDFSVMNMLFTSDMRLFLIDPIPDVFGCTELDIAKFIASLHLQRYRLKTINRIRGYMIQYNELDMNQLNAFVRAELLRVYKYHPNKQFIVECIRNVS